MSSTLKNILVIDDEEDIRQVMAEILSSMGYSVTCAVDGLKGVRELGKKRFDLAVTDMLMPEHDGIEFIREAKKRFPQVKLVAMSGGGVIAGSSYLTMATAFGVDAIMEKPFDIAKVLNVVEDLLAQI